MLLDAGVDVNGATARGDTPLMWAAGSAENNHETVQVLLEAGAAVNAKTGDGRTALMDAALRGSTETARLLLEAEIVGRLDPIEYWFWGNEGEERVRYRKKVYFFRMNYVGGDLAQHDYEAEEVRWYPLDEAILRATYRTERQVLEAVKREEGTS